MNLIDVSQVREGFYASRIESCPGVNHFRPIEHLSRKEFNAQRGYFCVHCNMYHFIHTMEYSLRKKWDTYNQAPNFNALSKAEATALYNIFPHINLQGTQKEALNLYTQAARKYESLMQDFCDRNQHFPVNKVKQYVEVACLNPSHQHHVSEIGYLAFAQRIRNLFGKRTQQHLKFVAEHLGEDSFYFNAFEALLNVHTLTPQLMSKAHVEDRRGVHSRQLIQGPSESYPHKLTSREVKNGLFTILNFIVPVESVPDDLLYEYFVCGRKTPAASIEEAALLSEIKNPYKCEVCPYYHVGSRPTFTRTREQRISSGKRVYVQNPIKANRYMHEVMMGLRDY